MTLSLPNTPPDTPSERKRRTPSETSRDRAYWDAVDLHHEGDAVTGADVEGALDDANATSDEAIGFDLLRGVAPVDPVEALTPGTMLGTYRIEGVIGHGGMGLVYRAECARDRRAVAVKVLRPLHSNNPTSRLRFDREFEVMQKLDHPNIVPVRETGLFGDQRYLVMKLVDGRSLADADPPATDDETVRHWCGRFAAVARALNHAHANNVIHRDVKPSNLLMDANDRLMLTDFGIAHAAESETLTTTAAVIGTPVYMAPEQAGGEGSVGARSDVYALGATLYHWFTGHAPFDAKQNYAATVHAIHHEHPKPVRSVAPALPKPLAQVIERAMAKKPSARYATAEAMAEHLDCIARGEPVPKRQSAVRERVLAWALLATVAGVTIAAALVIPAWQNRIAKTERESAYFENITRASALLAQGFTGRATLALDACPIELRNFEWHYLDRRLRPWTHTLEGVDARVRWAASSADETCLAVTTPGTLSLFDTQNWRPRTIPILANPGGVGVSANGEYAVVGYVDGRVQVFRRSNGEALHTLRAHRRQARRLAFGPENTWFVSGGGDRLVRVWDVETGKPRLTFDKHGGEITAVAVSPDGARVASATWNGRALVWQVDSGKPVYTIEVPHAPRVSGLAFSPDGRWLAATHWGRNFVSIWAADTGRSVTTLWSPGGVLGKVFFSADGRRIVAGQMHQGIRAWTVSDWRPLPPVAIANGYRTYSARFPLAVEADACHVVDLDAAPGFRRGTVCLQNAVVDREQRFVITSRDSGPVQREWLDGRPATPLPIEGPQAFALSPDGRYLFAAGTEGLYRVDLQTDQATPHAAHGPALGRIALSSDGRLVATSGEFHVCITEADSGKVITLLNGASGSAGLAFVDDDTRLMGCSQDGTIRVWSVASGQEVDSMTVGAKVHSFAIDDQRKRFATVGWDSTVRLFARRPMKLLYELETRGLTQGIAFTPDGSRLLTREYEAAFDVWDTATGRRVLTHQDPTLGTFNPGRFLARGPSGLRFFSAGRDFRLHVWDGRPRKTTR